MFRRRLWMAYRENDDWGEGAIEIRRKGMKEVKLGQETF